jgi:hypothetical protein
MPASLPGDTLANNLANPNAGRAVLYSLMSGPKGSPLDKDQSGNASTGGLSNGIGFGAPPIIGLTAPASIVAAGYSDDYTLGVTKPNLVASADSTIMYIGGGRSNPDGTPLVYTAGFGIGMAGNGGSRDGGAGPAFTGFLAKIVTAAGAVANGVVVETGWVNRSGVSLVTGQSILGSSSAASAAVV